MIWEILAVGIFSAFLSLTAFILYIRHMDKTMLKAIEASMERQVKAAEGQLQEVAVVISGKDAGKLH